MRRHEEDDEEGSTREEQEEENEEGTHREDDVWYLKAKMLVDHVNSISKRLCERPGFCCSIDEMMKMFKGRCIQTVRMRAKPIKEGFKFIAICDAKTGYIYSFFPSGRMENNHVKDMVVRLVRTLPFRDTLKYIIVMDNFFTVPSAIKAMRDEGVGFIGTARWRRGWPSGEFKAITDTRLNSLYLLDDPLHFKVARWVDNGIVTMVTTVHTGDETIKRRRWWPRVTKQNKLHVKTVWGDDHVKEIEIPYMIDDYNHWMLGVDKSDQYISYYRPELRCQRYWMPIMFHCLDIIRVNAFIVCREVSGVKIGHKEFVIALINALLGREATVEYGKRGQQGWLQGCLHHL